MKNSIFKYVTHCYICNVYVRYKTHQIEFLKEATGKLLCPMCSMRLQILSTKNILGVYDSLFMRYHKAEDEAEKTLRHYAKTPHFCDDVNIEIVIDSANKAKVAFKTAVNEFNSFIDDKLLEATLSALDGEIYFKRAKKRGKFTYEDLYKIFPTIHKKIVKEQADIHGLEFRNFKIILREVRRACNNG